MDESKVERAVGDLVADYERRDGILLRSHVERLFEKRKLSVEESAEVIRQLSDMGISLEDEGSVSDEVESIPDDFSKHAFVNADDAYERLDRRLSRISKKLLTAKEEVELGRRMELGRRAVLELKSGITETEDHRRIIADASAARQIMITSNLRLVFHIAKPFLGCSDLDLDDLFQEGVTGLMRSVDKFDHTLGYKLSTYATWWIKQSITRALVDRGATIRLPVHIHDDVLRLKKAYKILTQTHPDRRVHIFELVDELAWSIDKVHFIQQVAALLPSSLDERINGYDDLTLSDILISDMPTPEDEIAHVDLKECIESMLSGFGDREKKIIKLRFGLSDFGHGATLEEIGQVYEITRERVRQIEAKVLDRLRIPSKANVLRDFLDT